MLYKISLLRTILNRALIVPKNNHKVKLFVRTVPEFCKYGTK